jgi:hypothetical protein
LKYQRRGECLLTWTLAAQPNKSDGILALAQNAVGTSQMDIHEAPKPNFFLTDPMSLSGCSTSREQL